MQIFTQQRNQIKLIIESKRVLSRCFIFYARELAIFLCMCDVPLANSWKCNISISSHFVTVFNHLLMLLSPSAHTVNNLTFYDSILGGLRKCLSLLIISFIHHMRDAGLTHIKHTFPVCHYDHKDAAHCMMRFHARCAF